MIARGPEQASIRDGGAIRPKKSSTALSCVKQRPLRVFGRLYRHEQRFGVQVFLTRLVDDMNQAAPQGVFVRQCRINLVKLERHFTAGFLNADGEGLCGSGCRDHGYSLVQKLLDFKLSRPTPCASYQGTSAFISTSSLKRTATTPFNLIL